jgi:hypothetical protein
MITCYVRYVLDMSQLEAFAEYGRLWMTLIAKLGGTHHGYFLPSQDPKAIGHGRFSFPGIGSEGPANVGVALFSFPDWDTYERYRSEAKNYEECRRATTIANETKCFTSYERNFMSPVA